MTRFAGSGVGGMSNGSALLSRFNTPTGLFVDPSDGSLIVTDLISVRRIHKGMSGRSFRVASRF